MELRPTWLFDVYIFTAPEISYTTVLRNALSRTFRKFISLSATAYARGGRKADAERARDLLILGARRPTKPISSPAKNELQTTRAAAKFSAVTEH